MEQLLSIKHIPIKVEVKVTRAQLKPVENTGASAAPSVRVSSKQDGSLCLKADPYRLDLTENRSYDVYVPSAGGDEFTLTYEAIARLSDKNGAKSGQSAQGLNGAGVNGGDAGDISVKRASRSIEAVLRSLPKNRNSAVSYSDGTLSINYSMNATQAAEIPMDAPKFEFIPGSIEFIISQMPELDIEYLGDPIYFPRSADPNYEPIVDVFA